MTERWRKKLGDLDKQGPSDDVFDLAKEGPRHTDEPSPGMRPSTRIATAVAAFALFALALSVFAVPALRRQGTQAGGVPTATPTQTTGLRGPAVYTDPMGFSIDIPEGWNQSSAPYELILSAPSGDPYVQINRVPGRPHDDSSFPLDYSSMSSDSQAHLYEGGQTYIIQWLTGSAAAPTAADVSAFEQITRSIAFPAWKEGETREGWTSVGQVLASASAQWITFAGDHYVASYGPPRALLGPAPTCPS